MATVRERLWEIDPNLDDDHWDCDVWVCHLLEQALNIPPDTENTPHAIAAAVLGMSEDELRRRLLWGERCNVMVGDGCGRVHCDDDGDHLIFKNAELLADWLTRPEQTDGGEG